MSTSRQSNKASDSKDPFQRMVEEWWNPQGPFRLLHRLNPLRVEYVKMRVCRWFGYKPEAKRPLEGLRILDVGCGGGLMAEALTRLGARVTALDASPEAIAVAKAHAKDKDLPVEYMTGRIEEQTPGQELYDVVTAFEVLEHVVDVEKCIAALVPFLKPRGLFIAATMNRTVLSYLFGVLAAEHVLGWVPRGAHDWHKLVRPSELVRYLENLNMAASDLTGVVFDPLSGKFSLKKGRLGINYLLTAVKG